MNKDIVQHQIISKNPEETFLIGKIVGENLDGGDVVALIGELGTGKTCFTQGVARGIGIPESYKITSPTFTIMNEYMGALILYHFDLYRLHGREDMDDIGYDEYFFGKGVSVIEWADKIKNILPDESLFISFTYIDEDVRDIIITGKKNKVTQVLDALKNGGF